jgi:hypothetical protein
MRTAHDYEIRSYTPEFVNALQTNDGGWVVFATVMLGFAAIWNVVAST